MRPPREQLAESCLVPLDQLVSVPLRKVVVGVDVQTPDELFLPRGERLGTDGLDVGQRHEAEHLQTVLGAEQPRKLFDDFGILGIATERDERHLQMVPDQEQHGVARVGGNLQPIERLGRHPHAFERMLVVAPLAHVVKKQREHEQLGRGQTGRDRLEPLAGLFPCAHEPLEVPNREQRVLVDCVLVVEVAHDPPGHGLELGKQPPEQPAVVHL